MILRLLLLLTLSIFQLYSNILCRQKIEKEFILIGDGYPSWVIGDADSLTFSPFVLNDVNVTKRNPLLGLSIIHHKHPFVDRENVIFKKPRSHYRFAIDDEIYLEENVTKPQVGLSFAEFSQPIPDNVIIIGGCCTTVGLSIGGKKFIDEEYIQGFIESENGHFADIGARFKDVNGTVIVDKVNPFFTDNPFLEGDKILYLDGEPVLNFDDFIKNILFSPIHRVVELEVLRDNDFVNLSVETDILKGGGLLSDTFLENIGVWFDEKLYVVNVHSKSEFAKKGLKNRYRLISINGKKFKNEEEIREFLSEQKNRMPDRFTFLFKHKDRGELTITLKSNKKFFKNTTNSNPFSQYSLSFGEGGIGTENLGTGSFNFYGNWNGKYEDDINNSFYDIYNQLPLAEYLISY